MLLTPMFSPYKPAKLYRRYVYDDSAEFDGEVVEVQSANYAHHSGDTFKWMTERQTQSGLYKVDGRILSSATNLNLRTNSHMEINRGDLVWLHHPLFPEGKYLLVTDQVDVEMTYRPKPTIMFQHLKLGTVNITQPNIEVFNYDDENKEEEGEE